MCMCRQSSLGHGGAGSGSHVLQDLQEEVDRVVRLGAIRGGLVQCVDVGLLRHPHRRPSPPHHQHRRLHSRNCLSRHFPSLRGTEIAGKKFILSLSLSLILLIN